MSDHLEKKKRVLVVDDHPIVRQGIRALLAMEKDLLVCAEAENAGDALQAFTSTKPDVVVMDISMAGTDGLDLTKSIRAQDATLPILIISMHDESLYAERALRAGANGYIMKQEIASKVVDGIRQILRGEIYVSDEIEQRILRSVHGCHGEQAESPIERLSDRELEVFTAIGQGFGTRQIAEKLHLSVKTIETYRAHIKQKLNLDNAAELVKHAVQWIEWQNTP